MTKDIMRAAIAKDITEAKENNIKLINKLDLMLVVIQSQLVQLLEEHKF